MKSTLHPRKTQRDSTVKYKYGENREIPENLDGYLP